MYMRRVMRQNKPKWKFHTTSRKATCSGLSYFFERSHLSHFLNRLRQYFLSDA